MSTEAFLNENHYNPTIKWTIKSKMIHAITADKLKVKYYHEYRPNSSVTRSMWISRQDHT